MRYVFKKFYGVHNIIEEYSAILKYRKRKF